MTSFVLFSYTDSMERIFAAVKLEDVTPSSIGSFGELVSLVVFNAFVLAGVLSFVFLILGGFGVIVGAGGGDAKKLESAKNTIVYAVIGLLIVVGSLWIVQIVGTLAGIDILKPKI